MNLCIIFNSLQCLFSIIFYRLDFHISYFIFIFLEYFSMNYFTLSHLRVLNLKNDQIILQNQNFIILFIAKVNSYFYLFSIFFFIFKYYLTHISIQKIFFVVLNQILTSNYLNFWKEIYPLEYYFFSYLFYHEDFGKFMDHL